MSIQKLLAYVVAALVASFAGGSAKGQAASGRAPLGGATAYRIVEKQYHLPAPAVMLGRPARGATVASTGDVVEVLIAADRLGRRFEASRRTLPQLEAEAIRQGLLHDADGATRKMLRANPGVIVLTVPVFGTTPTPLKQKAH